ncbi:MAG TPA: adenylyltransferase/cytidyltransferase family protein [Candidatus Saccharimonadales bacterium]|jgi:nicotinate-nucleotide adenylyltransferase|nr:adenylyltransferase/cytidyltransferase family protein [Candidatus Saccharimonadales bacterium]
MRLQRIGIYPGTFDPVHAGHIALAQETLRVCRLDEIIFLPEQSPRAKQNVTGLAQRVALLNQALAATEGLRVVRLKAGRFTVTGTLPEVRQLFPDAELTLLVGSDVVRTFLYRWPGLEILLAEVRLAVGLRNHDTSEQMAAIVTELEQRHNSTIPYALIRTPHTHVSSSHFRNNQGESYAKALL